MTIPAWSESKKRPLVESSSFSLPHPLGSSSADIAWDKDVSILMLDATPEELETALKSFEGGPTYISTTLLRELANAPKGLTLTPREQEVARLLVQGLSNGEIAEALVISPHTVRTHLQAMSIRLQVSSRGKLAAKIRELGFV